MIPVKLDIQGLYSYKEKQAIEFEQLTAAGLFGIFGAVGSGKSSILEAILLALYGSTERLSDRGEKNSMVNLQSENLLINFEFKCGRNNAHTYLARYSAKRNPKNFDEIRPAEHTFYEKEGDHLEPLDKRAEEIVGMKKEHFKQTVIIPQGKFREFIDLTPGPRADMMKELFGLERFDLSPTTGVLLREVKDQKIRLETQLLSLEAYSAELLAQKEETITKTAFRVEKQESEFKATEIEFKNQEALQSKHRQLQEFVKEWRDLEEKLPVIEAKKSQWKDFLKAKTHLKPVWEQIKEKKSELEKYAVSVTDCGRFKEMIAQEVKQLEDEENELREKADKRSEREAKIRDLKKVIEIKKLNEKLHLAEKDVDILKPNLETQKTAQQVLSENIKQLETALESIVLLDTSQLAELKGNVRDWETWENQLSKLNGDFQALEEIDRRLKESVQQLQNELPSNEASFQTWSETQKTNIKRLEFQKEKLIQKQGLAAHVHLLAEGESCPLCGSMDHPNPLSGDSDQVEIHTKTHEIEKAKILSEHIISLAQQLSEQQIRLENNHLNLTAKKDEISKLNIQLNQLKEKLALLQIESKQSLTESIHKTEELVQKKEMLQKNIKFQRSAYEETKSKIEAEEKLLREAEQKLLNLYSTISAKKEEVKDTVFTKPFFDKEADFIEQTTQKVKQDIDETAFKLTGKQKVLQEKRSKQATNLANLKNSENSLLQTKAKLEALEQTFENLKEFHGFEDEVALVELFNHSLDADKVDAEIRQFEDRKLLVQSKLQELQSESGVADFNREAFEILKIELGERREALDVVKREFTLLNQEIRDSKIKLAEKHKLEEEFGLLQTREANLRELDVLFRGSGFVKYVSSIYLKELCSTANLRFMKLTKNSLSLEIDDSNTFWVVDYLNGGRKRLLKTLSGGQTFQASLCLALALAEKVKSLNQADQSFFFLDEGFGALDKNSLRVVFETLKSLRHENRIVGIISHVEELQQEIEVYAHIKLDSERGSQVGYSFKNY